MAKVKRSPKILATATKATTTTTPLKAMNGKVHKLRVNVKNLKFQTKTLANSLETSDLSNLHKSVSPKTRLCFVKLRQTRIKDKECSSKNNHSNTLQAQCKVIEKDVAGEDTNKVNNKRQPVQNKKNVEQNVVTAKDPIDSDETSAKSTGDNINLSKNKIESNSNNNKIYVSPVKSKYGLKYDKDRLPKETNPTKSTEKSYENESCITSTDNTKNNRRCFVKIKRTEQKTPTKTSSEAAGIKGLCMTPKTNKTLTRKCVVKLKRTPQLKTRSIRNQKLKIPVTSTPSTTRKCLVTLQRTSVAEKLTKKGEDSKTTMEVIDLTINDSPSIVPALDEVKRNNFRKLSLNQSPIRKLKTQNNNINKDDNKKTESKNDIDNDMISKIFKEAEDQIPKQANAKETKSSQSKSIRNTEKETTTQQKSAQLNHSTKIKRVQKLSLKKPCNKTKSTTVLEISQFQPQQNSTICFQPVRNSTLLEFEFIKDKNKDKQIEENTNKEKQIEENNNDQEKDKEDTSMVKNKSSSQNFANKSQEIENLLNSLEDENYNDRDKEKENLSSANNKSSKQNLCSKSQENENLINYLVDEYENDKAEENQSKTSLISKKPNKFFHRHVPENVLKEIQVVPNENNYPLKINHQEKNPPKNVLNKAKNKSPAKSIGATKKRGRFQTKRSSIPKRDNIYEFLSQSQTSDSDSNKHLDPAADIIKRLIAQGRVRVATNCKGKGRPILKRKARNKQQQPKRIKQNAANKKEKLLKNKSPNKEAQELNNNENQDYIDNDEHFMDDFDYNEPLAEVENDKQPPQDQSVKNITNQNHHISDQEGTFSRLARSVLINQAGRSDLQRQKAQRLLEMAKKFVSTPKNKKTSLIHDALHSDLSPIAMPPPRPSGNASPWRVNEDAHLPRVFNFYTSSDNLPSFSSDFIPSTPRKDKTKNKTILQLESITNQQPQSPSPAMNIPSSIASLGSISPQQQIIETTPQATNEQTVISSFSSNDSNAENMPPPRAVQENNNKNNDIFDLKQLPNPRRALNYRSPLKDINILEVVYLPPYKPNTDKIPQSKDVENDNVDLFGFEENLNNDSILAENDSASNTKPQKSPAKKSKKPPTQQENLFGFEDFLTQTDFSSQECRDVGDFETTEHRNKTMHDKLQDLRKLRPEVNDLQLSLLQEKNRIPQKTLALFENGAAPGTVEVDGMRQRDIKEMLCSTMIQEPQPSTSKKALAQLKKRNLKDLQRPNFGEGSNLSELFKDPEPETTFTENDAHRTYIRPYKRKRRLKQNKFVMFFDSDESGDEHDFAEHQKHHNSNETDTSSEKTSKKKRQRKEPKEKPELTEFIHEFNEMCKDVDSYELIVEKSA